MRVGDEGERGREGEKGGHPGVGEQGKAKEEERKKRIRVEHQENNHTQPNKNIFRTRKSKLKWFQ